jgi:hypothetical protein
MMMGGDVHTPIATRATATGPFPLGQGFKGYLVVAPSGRTFVAESTTGGIVGDTLENVREDIAKCDKKKNQMIVKANTSRSKDAENMTEIGFWRLLGESASDVNDK